MSSANQFDWAVSMKNLPKNYYRTKNRQELITKVFKFMRLPESICPRLKDNQIVDIDHLLSLACLIKVGHGESD